VRSIRDLAAASIDKVSIPDRIDLRILLRSLDQMLVLSNGPLHMADELEARKPDPTCDVDEDGRFGEGGRFSETLICGETGKRLERESHIADFFTDV
jgi:hypothetical protein